MKVSQEIATQEVEKWLAHKCVSDKRREQKKESIEGLIDCVMDGSIVIEEDFKIRQKLAVPLQNEQALTELVYAPRINVGKVQAAMSGVKGDDFNGMILAYGSALTGQSKNVLKTIDTEDYSVLNKVAVFFM